MDENKIKQEKTRGELQEEIQAVRVRFERQPNDPEARFRLAELLFQSGDFWEAQSIVQPLMQNRPATRIKFFFANLVYLLGDYQRAEEILLKLIPEQQEDRSARIQTEIRMLFTWYQTGQFAKAQDLFKGLEQSIQLPMWQQMKSFGDEQPYQIDWQGKTETIVPFIITDPLPIIELEIQGKRIYALIDTGGDNLYLDDQYAAELGIEAVASAVGKFGGGMQGKIGFAKGNHLKLGGIILNPVPITIMPTQRWSKAFADGKYTIGGVIGTSILKQFLATIDYPSGRLVLRPRSAAGTQALLGQERNQKITAAPFVLWQTHLMMAKGSLNAYKNLTYFVDSGLASPAAFIAPRQTLEYTGIPLPERKVDEEGIGGGGEGLWATGAFSIEKVGLGSLSKENVEGNYGTLIPETYWGHGFIQDGLISHQFLRDYRWTLDFDAMKYYFEKP